MFLVFLRYLKGHLKIRITGYSLERFLNLCKNKHIDVWGVESSTNTYLMYIQLEDFKKIKSILKKTNTKITVEERIGLPFFFYNYRKRIGFWIGCLFCIAILIGCSFFLWDINYSGNQTVTDEMLSDFLKEKDVYPGSLKKNISCENLVKEIRNTYPEIIWVSASMNGSKLKIEIKENVDTFEKEQEFSPCNLVARKDGLVMRIITRNGIPKVEKGSELKKGDVVVSGIVEVLNDAKEVVTTHAVTADADVTLQTSQIYSETISKKYKTKIYTGKTKKKMCLKFFSYKILLDFSNETYENSEIHTQEYAVKIGKKFFLPCQIGWTTEKEYQWDEQKYSDKELERMLIENFELYCAKLKESRIQVLENDFVITKKKNESVLNATLILLEEDCLDRKNIDF